jgi:hypothetical protein
MDSPRKETISCPVLKNNGQIRVVTAAIINIIGASVRTDGHALASVTRARAPARYDAEPLRSETKSGAMRMHEAQRSFVSGWSL